MSILFLAGSSISQPTAEKSFASLLLQVNFFCLHFTFFTLLNSREERREKSITVARGGRKREERESIQFAAAQRHDCLPFKAKSIMGVKKNSLGRVFFFIFFYFTKGRLYKEMKHEHYKSRNKEPPLGRVTFSPTTLHS